MAIISPNGLVSKRLCPTSKFMFLRFARRRWSSTLEEEQKSNNLNISFSDIPNPSLWEWRLLFLDCGFQSRSSRIQGKSDTDRQKARYAGSVGLSHCRSDIMYRKKIILNETDQSSACPCLDLRCGYVVAQNHQSASAVLFHTVKRNGSKGLIFVEWLSLSIFGMALRSHLPAQSGTANAALYDRAIALKWVKSKFIFLVVDPRCSQSWETVPAAEHHASTHRLWWS